MNKNLVLIFKFCLFLCLSGLVMLGLYGWVKPWIQNPASKKNMESGTSQDQFVSGEDASKGLTSRGPSSESKTLKSNLLSTGAVGSPPKLNSIYPPARTSSPSPSPLSLNSPSPSPSNSQTPP